MDNKCEIRTDCDKSRSTDIQPNRQSLKTGFLFSFYYGFSFQLFGSVNSSSEREKVFGKCY